MHGIRSKTHHELHTLRNKALYRGLNATARALKREQVRRIEADTLWSQ